ncbi:Hypothetical protein GLP15_3503 [Giardia lamblia P15]|uniref:Leucine-rich repeat protein n=1 Tax=Giardia intestinalis (strain P15) TaxID=658858 RepID=E1EVQ4_GIAIA|nr:Hypothetical protein GLP15_3503 [Giardia lamblia P15]
MPRIVFSGDLVSIGGMIFSRLAYTQAPLNFASTQLQELFDFCGVHNCSSTSSPEDIVHLIEAIGTLSLHNYSPETVTNMTLIFPAVRELIISIYTPHFDEILTSLLENRCNLSQLKEFKILNNRLTRKGVKQLVVLLESLTQLEALVLDNCGLYDYDIDLLLPAISWNTVTHVSLNRNNLTIHALKSILTMVRDRRRCVPFSLFLQDLDTKSTDTTIQALRSFTNSSMLYSKQSIFREFRLSCKQDFLQNTWSIVKRHIYIDLSRFEVSDAIAPDLGLFIYEWLRLATISHGGLSEATICLSGRITSSIRGTSNALSAYGLYLLCHRNFNELGLFISLDCTNCSLEFDAKKLRLPPDAIPQLVRQLKTNLAASLAGLSLSDCDLFERWKRQDIQEFISFLRDCKHMKRLDLRYNEFNKEFNVLFCKELEDIEFLPSLDTLEVDMLIDLRTLSISLQRRYSQYIVRYLDEGDTMFKRLVRGPVVLSCGSQTRGSKVPIAIVRMLLLDGDRVSPAFTQKLESLLFDNHAATLQNILGIVFYSPLKSITVRQSISSGALLKPVSISLWKYTDSSVLDDTTNDIMESNLPSAIIGDNTCSTDLSTQAAILVRAEIARTRRCTHESSRIYLQEVACGPLTLRSFLELVHKRGFATFNPQLLHIDFSHNSLTKTDIQELIRTLPLLKTLQALILSDCSLSDRVCAYILENLPSLLELTDLWYIDISENMFGGFTEQALSIFLQEYSTVGQRQITLNLRLKPGYRFLCSSQILLSAGDNISEALNHKILIWLIISRDAILSFSADDITNIKQRGINILSVISPVGRFYDHNYSNITPYLLRELDLPDHLFSWELTRNLYEHFMHSCA